MAGYDNLYGITYANSTTFVIVGGFGSNSNPLSGTILTSTDNGISWTSRTSGSSVNLRGVTYEE